MMKRCPIGLLALLLGGLFALPSFGQTNAPMRFSIHDACEGTSCPRYVLANGVIDKGTPKKFINFMKSIDFKPPVYFHSPGGDLGAGLELAITIRQYALDTYVGGPYEEMVSPSQPYRVLVERAVCYSACAYAFLGGISRELGETGSYGVHQFFRQKGTSKEGNVQIAAAMLSQFLDEMGVDRRLLDLASFTKKDEMRILPRSVAQALNVDNTNPPKGQWNLDTTNNGKLFSCVTQKQSRKNGLVTFCMTKDASGLVGSLMYLIKQKFRTQKELHSIFSGQPVLEFSAADRQIRITGHSAWHPMELGTFLITFDIPRELLLLLTSVKEFEFDVNFGNVFRDVNPGVTFSTEGLRPSIIALLNQR